MGIGYLFERENASETGLRGYFAKNEDLFQNRLDVSIRFVMMRG
jgi:hypothetical protein